MPQATANFSGAAHGPAKARGAKAAWSSRITGRMVVFAVVILTIIGYPVYLYLDATISGGIKHKSGRILVDLKAMSDFEIDQIDGTDEDIPPQWRELDGQRVECFGEMWAPYSAGSRLGGFQLCYSIAKCCFNGPPKVQHFVQVTVPEGRDVNYYQGLVRATGLLRVKVTRDQGKVQSIYVMEMESLSPA